jgi:hypothetical protein
MMLSAAQVRSSVGTVRLSISEHKFSSLLVHSITTEVQSHVKAHSALASNDCARA